MTVNDAFSEKSDPHQETSLQFLSQCQVQTDPEVVIFGEDARGRLNTVSHHLSQD